MVCDAALATALMGLAHARGPDKSFCPSEAARAVSDDWRSLMPQVRRIAQTLPLQATQKGCVVELTKARGPIRLRLASNSQTRP